MLLIEFADGMRLEMVGLGEAEGLGRQLEGLEVTEPCGLEATMRGRRLAALRSKASMRRFCNFAFVVCEAWSGDEDANAYHALDSRG